MQILHRIVATSSGKLSFHFAKLQLAQNWQDLLKKVIFESRIFMFHLELLQLALNTHISSKIYKFGSITFEFHLVRSNGLRINASFEIYAISLHLVQTMHATLKIVAID